MQIAWQAWDIVRVYFRLYTPHSTLYTPHSTLYTLHFTLYTLHSTIHALHTLHSPLHTLHCALLTLHKKFAQNYFPVPLCTTKLAQSQFPVLRCKAKLAQSFSQFYFVLLLQSLHKALPSTTQHYKACTKHFPILLCTTKLAESTSQLILKKQTLQEDPCETSCSKSCLLKGRFHRCRSQLPKVATCCDQLLFVVHMCWAGTFH